MEIQINFIFTPKAEEMFTEQFGQEHTSWPSPDLAATPLAGDLISFGGDDAPMFEVRNRLFMWKTRELLVIQPLLALLDESEMSPEGK